MTLDPSKEHIAPIGTKGGLATTIKKLISAHKSKGVITYDVLNLAMPAEAFSSEEIEDAMAALADAGVQVVEGEDDHDHDHDEEEKAQKEPEHTEYESIGNINADDTGRTEDPVRMYLREMGSVELLSREGEIAIAKRIEAGREMMIGGICESPLAIESLIAWSKALKEGDILLREIIDLDATHASGSEEVDAVGEVVDGEMPIPPSIAVVPPPRA